MKKSCPYGKNTVYPLHLAMSLFHSFGFQAQGGILAYIWILCQGFRLIQFRLVERQVVVTLGDGGGLWGWDDRGDHVSPDTFSLDIIILLKWKNLQCESSIGSAQPNPTVFFNGPDQWFPASCWNLRYICQQFSLLGPLVLPMWCQLHCYFLLKEPEAKEAGNDCF